ncbi:type II toxin-antitoxin system Phd/YefM family antitoxin [Lichenibacterium dinghuense]|uniref:type II toxin-antitoxin system Phd/YefM family antitoxin n=1 Tax=Lichenibacterium dinghuense TaxID=2895977 RepID=UPI001EFF9357|nr:type II toxin-antitoxin system prevent-host-death family antitoxin [Lichenibacterium sp. 6Y81]
MDTFNIHEAKTHLSKLVERAAKGEPFVIAKAGKPMVKVVPYAEAEPEVRPRIGFLKGLVDVPDDFDEMGREEIERMFYGDAEG